MSWTVGEMEPLTSADTIITDSLRGLLKETSLITAGDDALGIKASIRLGRSRVKRLKSQQNTGHVMV
jgi:hypothetical protein